MSNDKRGARSKSSVEERLIHSMAQAVDIAEGKSTPSREYDLPAMATGAAVEAAAGEGGALQAESIQA